MSEFKNECGVATIFPLGINCVSINPTTEKPEGGIVSIEITGGTSPYDIKWELPDGGLYFGRTMYNKKEGDYKVTVIDKYGDYTASTICSLVLDKDCEFNYNINETPLPTPTPSSTPTLTPTPTPSITPTPTITPTPSSSSPINTYDLCITAGIRRDGVDPVFLFKSFNGSANEDINVILSSYGYLNSSCDTHITTMSFNGINSFRPATSEYALTPTNYTNPWSSVNYVTIYGIIINGVIINTSGQMIQVGNDLITVYFAQCLDIGDYPCS